MGKFYKEFALKKVLECEGRVSGFSWLVSFLLSV